MVMHCCSQLWISPSDFSLFYLLSRDRDDDILFIECKNNSGTCIPNGEAVLKTMGYGHVGFLL